jgi:hypothetical protein
MAPECKRRGHLGWPSEDAYRGVRSVYSVQRLRLALSTSGSGARIPAMTNTFWIAANITFDLATGEKKDILTLVNHEIDATVFKPDEAESYKTFVARRTTNISWTVDTTNLRGRTGEFRVIRGVQNVG